MTQNDNASDLTQQEQQALIERWENVKNELETIKPNILLLAVSKTKPTSMIATLASVGQRDFGENYVQEAIAKIKELKQVTANNQPLIWHYIGHIQRNKTKDLASYFDWVQGVDRLLIAERLSKQRPNHLPPLNICIQVNIDAEESKSGCHADELPSLIQAISQLKNIHLRGLMIIPEKNSHTAFIRAKQLFEQNRQFHANPELWDTLSMGMSNDAKQAIEAGSTMVRIGSAIFGLRDYH